jgi:hypothetical protein
MRYILATVGILCLTGAGPGRPADEDLLRLAAPSTPMVVGVGFHIIDFGRITAREESFDVTAYLELRWLDPRLAGLVDEDLGLRRVSADRIWTPRICYDNAVEPVKNHGESTIEVDGRGNVTCKSIISAKFKTPTDLRRFPFDSQTLMIRIALFNNESRVRFEAIPAIMRMHDDASVSDWTIERPVHRIESHRYSSGESGFSSLVYEVGVSRRSAFYFWRVLIPLTLLGAIPWVIFWFNPPELQPQISTCMTTFIALVTFNFGMDFGQPKSPNLTLLDKHALIGFLFVALAVTVVCRVHVAVRNGQLDRARAIQRIARRTYPIAYAATILANLLSS